MTMTNDEQDEQEVTVQQLAGQMYRQFEPAHRDSGERFYRLADGAPEWMTDVVRAGHGDILPDDWRYEAICDAVGDIEDQTDASVEELRERAFTWADKTTDVYNVDRARWLQSSLERGGYVDEAVEEWGHSDSGLYGDIGLGQMAERQEVYGLVVDALAARVDELEDEADEDEDDDEGDEGQ